MTGLLPAAVPRKKLARSFLIALSTAVVVAGLHLSGALDRLEWMTFDQRVQAFRDTHEAPSDVAVIMIDESSLELMNDTLGRFPWPRGVYAELLEFLKLGEPRAIVFDILFVEHQKEPGLKRGQLGQNDRQFVNATRQTPNVYHAMELLEELPDADGKPVAPKSMPDPFLAKFALTAPSAFHFEPYNRYGLPFPELGKVASGVGIVGLRPDRDGVYRRTRLFDTYNGATFPALSVAGIIPPEINLDAAFEDEAVAIGDIKVPLLASGDFLINMYGRFDEFSIGGIFASMAALRQGAPGNMLIQPDEFRDKIVFIGTSAAGLQDIKKTAIDLVPGVLVHAAVAANILSQDFLVPTGTGYTLFWVLLLSALTALAIIYSPHFAYQIGLPLALLALYLALALARFQGNQVYDIVAPILSVLGTWLSMSLFLTFTEGKDKRKVRRMLMQYVSKAVLNEVVDKYEDIIAADVGRREVVSILFSDIRGFTNISENVEPEAVVEILNTHLGAMVEIIIDKQDGTLDKFIGDAIMAFWGAPVRQDDHALRAVEAGVQMGRELERVNATLAEKGYPMIEIGVGINTGDVVLGNIGSARKLDYTVIGDNVNTASRMEGLTKVYDGCGILISESTFEALDGRIPCAIVDLVRVKGRKEPIGIYTPLALSTDPEDKKREAARNAASARQAFEHYKNGKWQEAISAYKELNSGWAQVMISRCQEFQRKGTPDQWDAVYTLSHK